MTDPRHRAFIAAWTDAYRGHFGRAYTGLATAGAREGATLSRFLTACDSPVEELMAVARRAWSHSGPRAFWCSKAVSISAFCARYGEIQAELSNNSRPVAAPAAPKKPLPDHLKF